MSIVAKETIEVIAQSIGIINLSSDAALTVAADAEYRLREIMQESIKCMRHSKRTVLTVDDVDSALRIRNMEPLYGLASRAPLRFKRASGHKDLFYIDDKEVDFKDVIEAPLPKAPLDTTVVAHWLAIEGVQPAIPENAPVEALTTIQENKKYEHNKEDGLPVDIRLPIRHVLSKELHLYFDKVIELIITKTESPESKKALTSLGTDPGIQPLVPYFSHFVSDEVRVGLSDLPRLFSLMRIVQSLLRNPHLHIEPYLHQLMPPIVTCIVAKRLGNKLSDNHWLLRDFSAKLVAYVCHRYSHSSHVLQARLTKTLINAFLDPSKALTQHYGAIQGLAALGSNMVSFFILPNLETYLRLLEPEMLLEKQKNEMKRKEAWRVYDALLCAVGKCLYDRLKLFPGLLSPSARLIARSHRKIVAAIPSKWETSADELLQQPPPKKLATDGLANSMATVSMPSNFQVSSEGFSTRTSDTALEVSSSAHVSSDGIMSGCKRDDGDSGAKRRSALLSQAWKENADAGQLLHSLFELFGEAIFSFIQPAEMSVFI